MEQQFGQCLAYGHLVAQLGLRSSRWPLLPSSGLAVAQGWVPPPSRESFIPEMGEMKQQNLLRPFLPLQMTKSHTVGQNSHNPSPDLESSLTEKQRESHPGEKGRVQVHSAKGHKPGKYRRVLRRQGHLNDRIRVWHGLHT